MVLIILAALLSVAAFVVLVRLLWLSGKRRGPSGIVVLAAVVLLAGLAVLTATGRLHWLAALGTAVLPFLRRGVGLIRWIPWLSNLYQARARAKGQGQAHNQARSGTLTPADAREILGLESPNPTANEVIAAHRRLIQKLHPDRGGSNYLAQQLNEAKRVLLEGRKSSD